MTDDDGRHLSRRLHWEAEAEPRWPEPDAADRWEDQRPTANEHTIETAPLAPVLAAAPSFERRDLQRMDEEALDRRRQLWRDTAIILSGLVVAIIVANMVFPRLSGLASASPTPLPTGVNADPTLGFDSEPAETAVPIVDPSLGIDATPTPIPIITLPPTGTAAPFPGATPKATPRATPRATRTPAPPTPGATPAPTPEPTPEITPPPEPTPAPTPEATLAPGP